MDQLQSGKQNDYFDDNDRFQWRRVRQITDEDSSLKSFLLESMSLPEASPNMSIQFKQTTSPLTAPVSQNLIEFPIASSQKVQKRKKRGTSAEHINNKKCQKKNYPILLTRDIKSFVNQTIELKKRGKLSNERTLFQRYLQFFSKGSKMPESKTTLQLFLIYSSSTVKKDKQIKVVREFSAFIQKEQEFTPNQFEKLSNQMRNWIVEEQRDFLKFVQQRKDQKFSEYSRQFLQDLEKGAVKSYSKRK